MNNRALRRLLVGGAALGLLTGCAAALSSSATAHSGVRPQLPEARIIRIALRVARQSGDPRPILIQHTAGTRAQANQIASGAGVPGDAWSYLIAVRGRFIDYGASVPPAASLPRGTVITLVLDAATGELTDEGISYRYPPLAHLGRVTTDFRAPSVCPRVDTRELTSPTPGAGKTLVPAGARQVLLCRYSGLNPIPANVGHLVVQRLVRAPVTVARLATGFDALPPFPSGTFSCPADFGVKIVAFFRYAAAGESDDPVTIDPNGCASASNGHGVRSAMGAPGTALIEQLETLTRRSS